MTALATARAPALPAYRRTCLECGEAFVARNSHGEFCGDSCRKGWNNRRMMRGAELYDLFMALRHDRVTAYPMKLWSLISRMARDYRHEDKIERGGRLSWHPPKTVLERRPYLRAVRLVQGRRRDVD